MSILVDVKDERRMGLEGLKLDWECRKKARRDDAGGGGVRPPARF